MDDQRRWLAVKYRVGLSNPPLLPGKELEAQALQLKALALQLKVQAYSSRPKPVAQVQCL